MSDLCEGCGRHACDGCALCCHGHPGHAESWGGHPCGCRVLPTTTRTTQALRECAGEAEEASE